MKEIPKQVESCTVNSTRRHTSPTFDIYMPKSPTLPQHCCHTSIVGFVVLHIELKLIKCQHLQKIQLKYNLIYILI